MAVPVVSDKFLLDEETHRAKVASLYQYLLMAWRRRRGWSQCLQAGGNVVALDAAENAVRTGGGRGRGP